MAQVALVQKSEHSRRNVVVGILFMVLSGLIIYMSLGTAGEITTFVLTSHRAGLTIASPDLVIPSDVSLWIISLVVGVIGLWILVRGSDRLSLLIVLVASAIILAFLVWAATGKSLNLTGMLVSSLIRATPIALAALSGIYSERSGVVNIGIEGMMLVGAFTSVVVASVTNNMWFGVLGGVLAGMAFGALHAVLSIKYMVNQIVSGAGIIILALGLTSYLQRAVLNVFPGLNQPGPAISAVPIPVIWRIPVAGPVLFNLSPLIYIIN